MSSESDYDTLLFDLYGGIAEPDRLGQFLHGLCAATQSHAGLLLKQDFACNSADVPHIIGIDAAESLHYEVEYAADNIWFQRSLPYIRTGSVHFGDDRVSRRELQCTRYYQEFLRFLDVSHSLGICGLRERERVAFLTLCRSERLGAYEADERELIQRIAPHWVNAYALLTRMEALRVQTDWLHRLRQGMFLLDADFRWRDGNDSAEAILALGWLRGRRNQRLDPVSGATRHAWSQALKRIGDGGSGLALTFPIHDACGRLVALARLSPYGSAANAEWLPAYVLFVAPLQGSDLPTLSIRLRDTFGLTAAESHLALALHAQGDVALAARAMGITIGTARTRLQSIFDKTGLHNQSGLHRAIDALNHLPD